MCDDLIVDLVRRDTVMPERSFERERERECLNVADSRRAIQAQNVSECDISGRYTDVLKSFGLMRPEPLFCVPGLMR